MSFFVHCVNSEFRFQDLLSGGGRCKSSSSVSTHRMAIIFCFLLTTKWVIEKLRGHYEVGSHKTPTTFFHVQSRKCSFIVIGRWSKKERKFVHVVIALPHT